VPNKRAKVGTLARMGDLARMEKLSDRMNKMYRISISTAKEDAKDCIMEEHFGFHRGEDVEYQCQDMNSLRLPLRPSRLCSCIRILFAA